MISVNPANEEILDQHQPFNKTKILTKIENSYSDFLNWKNVPIEDKSKYLIEIASSLNNNIDYHALLISSEMGKPIREAKLEIKDEYMIQGYNSYESGLECGRELMKLKVKPTAVFAANDEMASGVMKVILDSGYEVPKDFSIAGFDDTPVTQMLNPPLSTVKQPLEKMGELAAKKLIAELEGLDFFENHKPKSSLIIRESIAER